MAVNSKRKGKYGELEAAKVLSEMGFGTWKRGKQYDGSNGNADIVCEEEPKLWCEVKRELKSRALEKAMAQAVDDAQPTQCPFVLHRRNGQTEWLITVRAADLGFLASVMHELRNGRP